MGFFLFILVNAIMFVRPAEIVPALAGLPLYQPIFLVCLACSLPAVIDHLVKGSLLARPVTICVFGLLLTPVLSALSRGQVEDAATAAVTMVRIDLYYLIFVGVVNSASRLRLFLFCLACFILTHTVAAVLNYHGIIEIPGVVTMQDYYFDKEAGQATTVARLRSTGLYEGPNSFSQLIVLSMLICLYGLGNSRSLLLRPLWLPPLGFLGYALRLTQSRGGLLTLMVGLGILFRARYGWRKTLFLGGTVLPALLLLFGGRQTEISSKEKTARERMDLWAEAYGDLRHSPLFGIGMDKFDKKMGLVVHNSYLHSFAEEGLLGGTFFLGGFVCALLGCRRLGAGQARFDDAEVRHLHPYAVAVIAAYAMGLLSLSRCYTEATYMIFGLGTAYLGVVKVSPAPRALHFDARLVSRLVIASALFLAGGYALCFSSN